MITSLGWRSSRFFGLAAGIGALMVTGCAAGSAPSSGEPGLPATMAAAAEIQLVSFDSCDQALSELKDAAETYVSAYGVGVDVGVGTDAATAEAEPDMRLREDSGGLAAGDASDQLAAPEGAPDAAAPDAAAGPGAEAPPGVAAPEAPEVPDRSGYSSYSGTNVHEVGVDEPDLVKTDGQRLVSLQGETLRVVDLDRREVAGSLEIPGAADQMLLSGDRLLVVSDAVSDPSMPQSTDDSAVPDPVDGTPVDPGEVPAVEPDVAVGASRAPAQAVKLVLVDVGGVPQVLERLTVDGGYVDARQVGSTARVVLRSSPQLPVVYPDNSRSQKDAERVNRQAVEDSTIEDWLPHYVHETGGDESSSGPLTDCAKVSRPAEYSGTSMLNVVTVDLDSGLDPLETLSVLGDSQTVYATAESLYVANGDRSIRGDEDQRTQVHKFDFTGSEGPSYRASGTVDGWLLNQYAMSEHEGHLRVATTTGEVGGAMAPGEELESQSKIVVLAERDGRLTEVGQVGGLGKGERIYAVRFLGPIGHVVTFREVDPLYTIDLSDPADPQVLGELKIPGYSSYLHPASDARLIGVGQDATDGGQLQGAQVSLFDVSDLAEPRRTDMVALGSGSSEVETDPHAFLYWPRDELVVIPVRTPWLEPQPIPRPRPGAEFGTGAAAIAPRPPPAGQAVVLRLEGDSLTELGTIEHPTGAFDPQGPIWADTTIRRALVVGDNVWTVSAAGVMAHDVDDLSEKAWIPFD